MVENLFAIGLQESLLHKIIADPERNLVIAMGVVDNLGKGAAGQAVQNANLICGLPETAGLEGAPVWP